MSSEQVCRDIFWALSEDQQKQVLRTVLGFTAKLVQGSTVVTGWSEVEALAHTGIEKMLAVPPKYLLGHKGMKTLIELGKAYVRYAYRQKIREHIYFSDVDALLRTEDPSELSRFEQRQQEFASAPDAPTEDQVVVRLENWFYEQIETLDKKHEKTRGNLRAVVALILESQTPLYSFDKEVLRLNAGPIGQALGLDPNYVSKLGTILNKLISDGQAKRVISGAAQ